MKKPLNQNKVLGVALALAVILTVIWDNVELEDAAQRIQAFQNQPSATRVQVQNLPHSPTEIEILGEALAVKNLYQISDQQFLVIVMDGTKNRQAVHDPTHCFHSGGWTIDQETELPSAKGFAKQLQIHRPNQNAEVLFWYSDGKKHHSSPFTYWMKSTLRRMTLGTSSEEQVLVIVQKLSPSETTHWHSLFEVLPSLIEI